VPIRSFAVATSALAEDWMQLSSDNDRPIYIDMSSIQVSGFIRRATEKFVHAPPKHTPREPWIQYSILLVAYDCKNHRSRIDEMTFYLSDGTAEKQLVADPVLWDPSSPNDEELDLICTWRASK
jgi:hypothetical protein